MVTQFSPIEIYYYSHYPRVWIKKLFNISDIFMPEINWARVDMSWNCKFIMDDAGRSTAKSYDHFGITHLAKCILLPNRYLNLFAVDEKKGEDLFDDIVGLFLHQFPQILPYFKKPDNAKEPKILHSGRGARILLKNRSQLKTYSPGITKDGVTALSDRCNILLFNEWTSWPGNFIKIMEERLKPVVTRTNYYYRRTMSFRMATEKSLNVPLGRITNELLSDQKEGKKGFVPRKWLLENQAESFEEARTRFLSNFKKTYGFDYAKGVSDNRLRFEEINSVDNIVNFFSEYLEGDCVFQNQIVYDSSAQRPSDPHHYFVEEFLKKVDTGHPWYQNMNDLTINAKYIKEKLTGESPNPYYVWFNCHVDDIPDKYDGLIFDGPIIDDARQKMDIDEFSRIYGGMWTEQFAHRPFDPKNINDCRTEKVKLIHKRGEQDEHTYIMAIDSAQGTDSLSKGMDNRNKRGRGDDATAVILELHKGTRLSPHKLRYVYKADDVSKHPMARDIHELNLNFNCEAIGLDPGGGAKSLVENLGKRHLEIDGKVEKFQPLIMIDSIEEDDEVFPPKLRVLQYLSRSNEIIREVYRQNYKTNPFSDEGTFRNTMVEKARDVIRSGGLLIPAKMSTREMKAKHRNGEMSYEDLKIQMNLEEMLQQVLKIEFAREKDGTNKKTKSGQYEFKYPRRKDLAITLIYLLFFADILVKMNEKLDIKEEDRFAMSRG